MSTTGSPSPLTIGELLHALRNSLSLVAGHAESLSSQPRFADSPELRVLRREAERAVLLLARVPETLADIALPPAVDTDPTVHGPGADRLTTP